MQRLRVPDETIVAPATPPGRSAVSLIRLTGPRTRELLLRCLRFRSSTSSLTDRVARTAQFVDPRDGATLDQVLVTFFAAPRSYTGEDLAEVGFHGSPSIVAEALRVLRELGARAAARGEFTRRAVRNGKLELAQAEAVGELVRASTPEAAKLAAGHLGGALARRYQQIHELARAILASLEGPLEFPDDTLDDERSASIEARARIDQLQLDLESLAESRTAGRRITNGIEVAILGRTNAGKSSIFNYLLRDDRAIVSARPGTTRDWIDATLALDDRLIRLVDTAGYGAPSDPDEAEGQRRTQQRVEASEMALLVFDASSPITEDDVRVIAAGTGHPCLPVLNKIDLPRRTSPAALAGRGVLPRVVEVSATTGQGMEDLRRALIEMLEISTPAGGDPSTIVTSARQAGLLLRASEEMTRAGANLASGASELAVEDVRTALRHLDELVGAVTHEELLDSVFQSFCIGK